MSSSRAKPSPPSSQKKHTSRSGEATQLTTRSRPIGVSVLLAFLALLIASVLLPSRTTSQHLIDAFGVPGKALVLTAHPDDEVMFLSPSILGLKSAGWDIWGLCLSTGNADGLGSTRRHELTASYEILAVPREQVMVIDHPLLQDDMKTRWSVNIVGAVVDSYLLEHNIDMMITFDPQGISNHPNHASLSTYRSNSTTVYHLVSPPLITKYTGPLLRLLPPSLESYLAMILRALPIPERTEPKEELTLESDLTGWRRGVRAMLQHRTQMVWFRWLYVATSRLMWVNQLERVS